jgi:hypothetical protein
VPEAGFEPACPYGRILLRNLGIPVPPLGPIPEQGSEHAVPRGSCIRPRACPGWLNDCQTAPETGIPRQTILDWRSGRTPDFDRVRTCTFPTGWICVVCRGDPLTLPQAPYTYLLGLYLGDGYIASHARGVYRLRIYCANAYPELIRLCENAMGQIIATNVSRVACVGCSEVSSFSKHWPCLFPQHGPGRKHERRIALAPWQQELVDRGPRPLVRGLLHSDGCRVLNWVNGTPYPRYHFSNRSADIRGIFGRPVTSWASSGGRTTPGPCRWPGGGAWPSLTSSWGPSDEGPGTGTAPPARTPPGRVRGGCRRVRPSRWGRISPPARSGAGRPGRPGSGPRRPASPAPGRRAWRRRPGRGRRGG